MIIQRKREKWAAPHWFQDHSNIIKNFQMCLSFSVTSAIPNCKMTLVANICAVFHKKHVFKGFTHPFKPFLVICSLYIFCRYFQYLSFYAFLVLQLVSVCGFLRLICFGYDEKKRYFQKCHKASLRGPWYFSTWPQSLNFYEHHQIT